MKSNFLKSFAFRILTFPLFLTIGLSLSLVLSSGLISQVQAQDDESISEAPSEGSTTGAEPEGELQSETAITDSLQDEEPPPPEAPYPGAAEEGFAQLDPSSPAPPSQTIQTLENPIQRGSDGTYYYGVDDSPRDFAASVRGGLFGAPAIQNPRNGRFFEEIYQESDIPTIFLDFEWQLKTFVGDLGIKAGTGIFYAQGDGKFANPDRQFDTPPEEFTFIMAPNTLSAIYRLSFHEKQPIVPYAEGGVGYFTFMELRDDDGGPKFAGAPVTFFAAGAAFLLDWLDPKAVRDLDREYGINHVYLTAEYREIIGLDDTYDFSSRVIGGGIMMEF